MGGYQERPPNRDSCTLFLRNARLEPKATAKGSLYFPFILIIKDYKGVLRIIKAYVIVMNHLFTLSSIIKHHNDWDINNLSQQCRFIDHLSSR